MTFDPTKPVEGTEIDAVELRNQFNALKTLIDAQQTQITALQSALGNFTTMEDVNSAIAAGSANNVDALVLHGTGISNPPTANDVQMVMQLVNALLQALKHQGS
jgi:prefoldin subunit 5